jgi:hypothetical protein
LSRTNSAWDENAEEDVKKSDPEADGDIETEDADKA